MGDALRGAKMFEKVNVPVFGVVENMSGFTDPETGRHFDLFGKGGGQRLAEELGVPLLAQVPLQPGVVELADRGKPIVAAEPDSPASQVLIALAGRLVQVAGGRSIPLPILRG